ncbi:MAG: tetrahydromethanopterin S-methyltransferase subunit D [Canidatus Methanoxibalbensis ujae]|nr:tetrahydromethanopterin S-methyltransferase subunit D [Candidatus Methanoxibalbensis ujae]MCW7078851.1 tetrahydromethanopterin S-methyltransferase subunit D [Candidatus Methanoxibalbensis ujae]
MDPITALLILVCVIVGGLLASLGVHMIPVGGAPAAMGTATGIATGTVQLMFGAALTGLFTASTVATFFETPSPLALVLVALSGAVGAMLMMSFTMLFANMLYVFGAGVVPVSGRVEVDPITKEPQTPYKTPQTDGHGVPNVSYISGWIGAFLGGFGGALMYFVLKNYAFPASLFPELGAVDAEMISAAAAGIAAAGIFVANAILSAYNIGGTIEGFHDPKFKRLPKALISCAVVSALCGLCVIIASWGLMGGGV